MALAIDVDAVLTPIPGENPSGEDCRYSPLYEEIKEARRADDPFDRGDWQREVKRSEWDKVIELGVQALTEKTKDLQIAVWLAEGLIQKQGFDGLLTGLRIVNGLLDHFWESVYPQIEEGDLEYRAAPFEFLNDKVWVAIKDAPITDPISTPGHSWFKWKESREVGFEADTRNRYGDVDEGKKRSRDESLADGKLSGEDFDAAVNQSPLAFYSGLTAVLSRCREEFQKLDATVDERFGKAAPRLAELKTSIEDCLELAGKFFKEKGGSEPVAEKKVEAATEAHEGGAPQTAFSPRTGDAPTVSATSFMPTAIQMVTVPESPDVELKLWESAVATMSANGIKAALGQLLAASCGAPSVREKNRYRVLMARLCLKAERPDLARPIAEELYALIEELHLDRWESPVWIAEVLDTLYQCLTAGEPSDDDMNRARILFQKLCTTDVTKALTHKL